MGGRPRGWGHLPAAAGPSATCPRRRRRGPAGRWGPGAAGGGRLARGGADEPLGLKFRSPQPPHSSRRVPIPQRRPGAPTGAAPAPPPPGSAEPATSPQPPSLLTVVTRSTPTTPPPPCPALRPRPAPPPALRPAPGRDERGCAEHWGPAAPRHGSELGVGSAGGGERDRGGERGSPRRVCVLPRSAFLGLGLNRSVSLSRVRS